MENYTLGLLMVIAMLQLIIIVLVIKKSKNQNSKQFQDELTMTLTKQMQIQNEHITMYQNQASQHQMSQFDQFGKAMQGNINTLRATVKEMSDSIDNRFDNFQTGFEKKVQLMQESNELKLDQMRSTVDEKLQKSLDDKISQSFKLVSERLEQVYTTLGEIQKLSTGVDDLKKVLGNVKTRGILGEVQLGAILEQILAPGQYEENVQIKMDSRQRVEYAIKLPGHGDTSIYLPIDAKFPLDSYQCLLDAYDTGDKENVQVATKEFNNRIKSFAKDIASKYIDVPHTTDFAIMFLPIEGMYAEVVRGGLFEQLQEMKISIAGPTTMAALLSSFQMGFKTLAIQKHSSEVWKVLEGVKQEFNRFQGALENAQRKMAVASSEIENLVGVRSRQMQRKLQAISIESKE